MLSTLEIFIKVVELGSFSAVSRVIAMSPSSISRQMDKLEAEFGVRLLNRTTHLVKPTEAGLALVPFADNALGQIEQAKQSVGTKPGEVKGFLRVSCFSSFGAYVISPLLPKFLKKHPHIKMAFNAEDRMVDLYKENVDLAIRVGMPQNSALQMRSLVANELALVATPDYLAKHGTPKDPEDLRHHNCLTFDRSRKIIWWHFRKGAKYLKVPVSGNLQSVGDGPLVQTALAGLGIMATSKSQVWDHIMQNELVEILPDWQANFNEQVFGIIWRSMVHQKIPKTCVITIV